MLAAEPPPVRRLRAPLKIARLDDFHGDATGLKRSRRIPRAQARAGTGMFEMGVGPPILV
jgi:hypothetical protein